MKRILLRPYPGAVYLYKTRDGLRRKLKAIFEDDMPLDDVDGYTVFKEGTPNFYVWAKDTPSLVHELSHVALFTFQHIGCDPREGDGEPFSYLIGHLFNKATK